MIIAVASGKGGTGKTTIATSLARVAAEQTAVRFLDCDVEAPNAALFLSPCFDEHTEVGVLVPVVNESLCTHCGRCAEVCRFHAIAAVGKKLLVFPELCHGCGSCTLVCPEKAISEKLDVLGVLERGKTACGIDFAHGEMNVGEPMAVPIIRELKKWKQTDSRAIEIRDSPPGASCPVVETIRGADFVLLVTEPTPFGLHDLKQVAAIVRDLGLPAGVVINREGIGDHAVEEFCEANDLPVLLRIPMERRFAEAIASGKMLIDAAPEYRLRFEGLLQLIAARAAA